MNDRLNDVKFKETAIKEVWDLGNTFNIFRRP